MNVFRKIVKGTGGLVGKHHIFCDLADEEDVITQIHCLYYLGGKIHVGEVYQIGKAVGRTAQMGKIRKLFRFREEVIPNRRKRS